MQTIRVGSLPVTDEIPFFVAIEYGIFAKYGLQVQITSCAGSGPCLEGLESNNFDAVLIAPPAVISFAAQTGNYLHFLTSGKLQGNVGSRSGDGPSFLVRSGVTVSSPTDLQGKTILTNAIGGPNYVVPLYLLEKAGVSNKTVTWKEVRFPNMPLALTSGQADAASMAQPFAGAMLANKTAYSIDNLFGEHGSFVNALGNPAMVSSWWTTPQKYQQNPDLYNRFFGALSDGLAYAYALPDFAYSAANKYTKTPVNVLSQIAFTQEFFQPYNSSAPQVRTMLQNWVTIMSYTGYLNKQVNIDTFLG